MKVYELIEKLQTFPLDAFVVLVEELGADHLREENINLETMNYIEYPPVWEHHPPSFGFEYPEHYKRKIISTHDVVTIK